MLIEVRPTRTQFRLLLLPDALARLGREVLMVGPVLPWCWRSVCIEYKA